MIRVYIAHPYGGLAENRESATRYFMRAAELGYEPVAPWLTVTAHWNESRRELGMAINRSAVRACDEVWLCGPQVTPGMLEEALTFSHSQLFSGEKLRRFLSLEELDAWASEAAK